MMCGGDKHVFEYAEDHEFNPGSVMPYGGPGLHTCKCGEVWIEPEKPRMPDPIKEGTMIHDILTKKHLQ